MAKLTRVSKKRPFFFPLMTCFRFRVSACSRAQGYEPENLWTLSLAMHEFCLLYILNEKKGDERAFKVSYYVHVYDNTLTIIFRQMHHGFE
jgi:hypothetical protein